MYINGQLVTDIELSGQQVIKIEDSQGTVLYEAGPAKSLTLRDSGYGFSWSTSDGRSGTVSVGDPDYTLTIEYGQTLAVTTDGPKYKLCINGNEQGNGPDYSFTYAQLSDGDVIDVIFDGEPS